MLFEPWSIGLVRSPVRPVTFRLDTGEEVDPPAALRLLVAASADAELMMALEVASPDLAEAVASAVAAGLPEDRKAAAALVRTALAVHRYARRAATRPTPFGLFAGVAPVRFGDRAEVVWRGEHRMVARADLGVLGRLARLLEQDENLLPHLDVQLHQLVEQHGDRLVMPNPTNPTVDPGENGRVSSSVRLTRPVAAVCEFAQGPVNATELVELLARRFPAADTPVLWQLVRTLVREQMLITELRPSLGGVDPLAEMLGVLHRIDETTGTKAGAPEVRARLDRVAAVTSKLPGSPEAQELLRNVRGEATAFSKSALHVDLGLDLTAHLPAEVAREAARAAEVMWRMTPAMLGTPTLREFHGDFVERYGIGRLVPILELLDPDRGIGAPAGFEWPPGPRGGDGGVTEVGARTAAVDRVFARLLGEAARDGRREIVLDDATVAELCATDHDPATAPENFELYLHLVAEDLAAVGRGDFRLVLSPNPGSHLGGATLGRFHDVVPAEYAVEFAREVREHAAGSVPLPVAIRYETRSSRAANIARDQDWLGTRLSVGVPTSGDKSELSIRDIGVGATLEGLYAVHLPSGRRIRPMVFNMLNPRTQAPNPIRLLCEIAFEHVQMWAPWDWSIMGVAPYLPRVRYGRTVLWSATWSLESLRAAAAHPDRFHTALTAWRDEWRVPSMILATSNDQRIRLDLDNAWDVELLRVELKRTGNLVAQEVPGGDAPDGWLRSGGGAPHVAELTVPLARSQALPRTPEPTWSCVDSPPDRLALPGGEWLYAKLYLARERSDAFLREQLPALLDGLDGVDRWFFIRYSDPDYHVRLRLHGDPADLNGVTLPALNARVTRLRAVGAMRGFVLDAYDPEYERYGGPAAIAAAERFFQADSEAVVALLGIARKYGLDPVQLAAIGVAATVHTWGQVGHEEIGLVEDRWRHDPVASWLSTSGSRHDVPPGFRRDRQRQAALIDPEAGWTGLRSLPWGAQTLATLYARDEALLSYREVARTALEWTPESRVVGSLLHMHCNRLLGGSGELEASAMTLARACALHHADQRRHRGQRSSA